MNLDNSFSCASWAVDGFSDVGAWVSPSDGLFAYDYNADGLITEAKEFVFTMWGQDPDVATDMQALGAYFDTNHDGVFDSNDDAWQYFGIWQDLNTDGVQQEGEFYDLAHWSIESIALEYNDDSSAYSAADGDVQVFGQMAVTYSDGTTGLAEDAAFVVQAADPLDSLEALGGALLAQDAAELVSDSNPDASAYSVDDLVATYLHSMASFGDADGNGDLGVDELAYGLDQAVSDFIDAHGLSVDDHASLQQEVFDSLATDIADLNLDESAALDGLDSAHADGAEVLAALDHHFQEIYTAYQDDSAAADPALTHSMDDCSGMN